MIRIALPTAALLALHATGAAASEKRQLDAHVHGTGQLDIAVDGTLISLDLTAPGHDIAGFEHAAESAEDRAAIESGLAQLGRPMEIFTIPESAGCLVTQAAAKLVDEDDGHASAGDHGHEEHAHDHGAEAEDAHDHAHGHDHDQGSARHTEFRAEYVLDCADPGAVDTVGLPYFEIFPNAEELEIQIVTEAGARSAEATRSAPEVTLGLSG